MRVEPQVVPPRVVGGQGGVVKSYPGLLGLNLTPGCWLKAHTPTPRCRVQSGYITRGGYKAPPRVTPHTPGYSLISRFFAIRCYVHVFFSLALVFFLSVLLIYWPAAVTFFIFILILVRCFLVLGFANCFFLLCCRHCRYCVPAHAVSRRKTDTLAALHQRRRPSSAAAVPRSETTRTATTIWTWRRRERRRRRRG